MKNVFLYPYKTGSRSGKALAKALGIKRLRNVDRRRPFLVINWGSGNLPDNFNRILNPKSIVNRASNKLSLFNSISHKARCVPFTTDKKEAEQWQKDGSIVVGRKSLTGHSGYGIIIIKKGDKLPDCPLYTKYIPKDLEFRVHLVGKEIVDVQRKIRDPDKEPENWQVRSHDNGFIFVRSGFEVPEDVRTQAINAHTLSGLDFGAVDVIYNKKQGKAFILEINSAPGLTGQTIEVYKKALLKLISQRT